MDIPSRWPVNFCRNMSGSYLIEAVTVRLHRVDGWYLGLRQVTAVACACTHVIQIVLASFHLDRCKCSLVFIPWMRGSEIYCLHTTLASRPANQRFSTTEQTASENVRGGHITVPLVSSSSFAASQNTALPPTMNPHPRHVPRKTHPSTNFAPDPAPIITRIRPTTQKTPKKVCRSFLDSSSKQPRRKPNEMCRR